MKTLNLALLAVPLLAAYSSAPMAGTTTMAGASNPEAVYYPYPYIEGGGQKADVISDPMAGLPAPAAGGVSNPEAAVYYPYPYIEGGGQKANYAGIAPQDKRGNSVSN